MPRWRAKVYYDLNLVPMTRIEQVDAVIAAVSHNEYLEMGLQRIAQCCNGGQPLVIDVKGMFDKKEAEALGIDYWQL